MTHDAKIKEFLGCVRLFKRPRQRLYSWLYSRQRNKIGRNDHASCDDCSFGNGPCPAAPTTAAGQIQFGPVQTYTGMCEPSGAIAVPDGNIDDLIIIANDEDNILRAYNPQRADPLPLAGADLNKYLGTNPNDNDQSADFEGATWMNKKAYWIGSHSRSKKGNRRDSRSSFFATTVSGGSDKPVVTTGEKSFAGLLAAIAALSPRLEETIKLKTQARASASPGQWRFQYRRLDGASPTASRC